MPLLFMGLFDRIQQKSPAQQRIEKLRTGLLAFRFLYYIQAESIVSDFVYDAREAELKKLVEANPEEARRAKYADLCPAITVGSSDPYDYPPEIEALAYRLLAEHNEQLSDIDPAFLE